MNLDDIIQHATTILEEMDREIEIDDAAIQGKRRRRHRQMKFIEWLRAGDNELVSQLVHAPSLKRAPIAAKAPKPAEPVLAHNFKDIAPAAASLAVKLMAAFERERNGMVSSVEREKLVRIAGAELKLRQMLRELESKGLIRVTKQKGKEAREFVSVLFPRQIAEAAE